MITYFLVILLSGTSIQATRERLSNEITPVSAESSAAVSDIEKNGAANAIDLDHTTPSFTKSDPDDPTWLKVNLDEVHCIHQVIRYSEGKPASTWTCTSTDCSTCEPDTDYFCRERSVTVTAEKTEHSLPLIPDCKYGDNVKLVDPNGYDFYVDEIAIIGKQEPCLAGQYLDESKGCQSCPADHWSEPGNTAASCTACAAGKGVASGSGTQESDCTWRLSGVEGGPEMKSALLTVAVFLSLFL